MSAIVAILGPTAAGKTDLAIEVARHLGAEVISVDSMQVYRGMDIGTAKPTLIERKGVVHHMIDVVDPSVEYTVADFRRMGRQIIEDSSKPLIISGGSGLHFRALVDPMNFAPTNSELRSELEAEDLEALVDELTKADDQVGLHVDLANPRRVIRAAEILRLTGETPSDRAASAEAGDVRRYVPEVDFLAVGVDPGEFLDGRVRRRLKGMRSGGLVDEVAGLKERMGRTAQSAVGYREVLDFLEGKWPEEEAFQRAESNTRRLAKRQRTWFQRDPRIQWIPWVEDLNDRAERTLELIA